MLWSSYVFVSHIEEDSGSVFGIVTSERTYYLTAESQNDRKEWSELIRRVKSMPEAKIKSVLAEEVDARKALMTIDLELIDSVAAIQNEKKYEYHSNAWDFGFDYKLRNITIDNYCICDYEHLNNMKQREHSYICMYISQIL